jgi:hypothetical protein
VPELAVQKQHGIHGRSVGAHLFMRSLQGLLMHGRNILDHLQPSKSSSSPEKARIPVYLL